MNFEECILTKTSKGSFGESKLILRASEQTGYRGQS